MTAMTGPCEAWTPIWCCELPTGSEAVTGTAVMAATEVLWHATAQRFGLCSTTLRPCRRECDTTWPAWTGGRYPTPALTDRGWVNVACGGCGDSCSCTDLEEAILPGPVYAVTEVKVDGVVLATDAYRMDNHRLLVRVDGGVWPTCQYLDRADTETGTWSVTAQYGEPVPTLGQQAVGELACEMARACLGEECRLPLNVQQLVRQGVSISFSDSTELAERGYFGGLFVQTYNPHRLTGRAQVYDVDAPWRRTNT